MFFARLSAELDSRPSGGLRLRCAWGGGLNQVLSRVLGGGGRRCSLGGLELSRHLGLGGVLSRNLSGGLGGGNGGRLQVGIDGKADGHHDQDDHDDGDGLNGMIIVLLLLSSAFADFLVGHGVFLFFKWSWIG